jgi:hypothetical protein
MSRSQREAIAGGPGAGHRRLPVRPVDGMGAMTRPSSAERLAAQALGTSPKRTRLNGTKAKARRRVRINGATRGDPGALRRPRTGAEILAARVLRGETVQATAHWRRVSRDWVRF